GNVTSIVDPEERIAARYEYDPYGNLTAKAGPFADLNSYRFSSKEAHDRSGLVYYGYRFYAPQWQRWVNRDPIGEELPMHQDEEVAELHYNLHTGLNNSPLIYVDPDGEVAQAIPVIIRVCTGARCAPPVPVAIPTTCTPGLISNCPPDKLAALTAAKKRACDPVVKCEVGDSPAVMRGKIAQARKCIRARRMRDNTCFQGGNPGHHQAVNQLINLISTCRRYLRKS
ncbi:MAG: RHS repeat-associated core domain-containing protein, partial [Verrucomicrobiota bacterium]|nr:RHS repeat-associated core domain-containing protein [Verrucomicrobiota bacterium]